MKEVLLIDYSNLMYRVHYTHRSLTTSDGVPTGVLHGVLQSVLSLHKKYPDSKMVFCCDTNTKSWRKEISASYKATRKVQNNPDREVVATQIPTLNNLLALMGFRFVMVPGFEADDIIASLSFGFWLGKDYKVRILSGDKDFFQLINPPHIELLRPKDQQIKVIKPKDVEREHGVKVEDWVKFRALMGDPSDNIKPIKGVGPKKAQQLLADGVDPTLERFLDQPKKVQRKHPELLAVWPAIREAFKLSNLRDHYAFLEPSAKKSFAGVFRIECEKALKHPQRALSFDKKESEKRLDKVVEILAAYELDHMLARRHEFFQIP